MIDHGIKTRLRYSYGIRQIPNKRTMAQRTICFKIKCQKLRKALGGRFELPSYRSTSFPDLRLTRLGYPSLHLHCFNIFIVLEILAKSTFNKIILGEMCQYRSKLTFIELLPQLIEILQICWIAWWNFMATVLVMISRFCLDKEY